MVGACTRIKAHTQEDCGAPCGAFSFVGVCCRHVTPPNRKLAASQPLTNTRPPCALGADGLSGVGQTGCNDCDAVVCAAACSRAPTASTCGSSFSLRTCVGFSLLAVILLSGLPMASSGFHSQWACQGLRGPKHCVGWEAQHLLVCSGPKKRAGCGPGCVLCKGHFPCSWSCFHHFTTSVPYRSCRAGSTRAWQQDTGEVHRPKGLRFCVCSTGNLTRVYMV